MERTIIQLFKSTDGGRTWQPWSYVGDGTTANLTSPSLAIGKGMNGEVVLLAYVKHDGAAIPHIEVSTKPLDSSTGFVAHSLAYFSWEGYTKPVIWTDSFGFSNWYAYLTAEGVYDAPNNNINIVLWRSTNGGVDWGGSDPDRAVPSVLWGNTDGDEWIDPDGSVGTSHNRVFLVCFNNTDDTIYSMYSDDGGATFSTQVTVASVVSEPTYPVDPEIEAATTLDNVMVVATKNSVGFDRIGQVYSTDAGASFGTFWDLDGQVYSEDNFAPTLTANEGGGSWHLVYTSSSWRIKYNHRPQDFSAYWGSEICVVNDTGDASASFPIKGITSDWVSDRAGVAWSDFRNPGNKVYYDGIPGIFSDGFESADSSGWSSAVP